MADCYDTHRSTHCAAAACAALCAWQRVCLCAHHATHTRAHTSHAGAVTGQRPARLQQLAVAAAVRWRRAQKAHAHTHTHTHTRMHACMYTQQAQAAMLPQPPLPLPLPLSHAAADSGMKKPTLLGPPRPHTRAGAASFATMTPAGAASCDHMTLRQSCRPPQRTPRPLQQSPWAWT
jgi:hypothetical protein